MALEHDKLDPCKAQAWRAHVHMTHAQKFEVGYRRAVLGPTALSWRIDIVMQCQYLSHVSYTYAMF